MTGVAVSGAVRAALDDGRPVVALESTIFSELGLPSPVNGECLDRCLAAVRSAGAEPAVTAVLDGEARVGLDDPTVVLELTDKAGARDLGPLVGAGASGATTVSAALHLAAAAGIAVFATGGIGGVHRGATGDVSNDLVAIARHPVVTVTAGAKGFLDLPRTVEALETMGVPVLGLATDEFPAFWSRTSGLPVSRRVEAVEEAAAAVRAARDVGHTGGVVLANPVPAEAEIPASTLEPLIESTLARAEADGVAGAEVTPVVLAALGAATDGATLPANVALAEHNAAVAAALAVALAEGGQRSEA